MNETPQAVYQQLIGQHQKDLQALLKKKSLLGWIRLVFFIAFLLTAYHVFSNYGPMGIWVIVVGLPCFLALVSLDTNYSNKAQHLRSLLAINEEELRILQHDFHQRFDGNALQPAVHDYAHDLDLFGHASLYQWLQRCHTEQGRRLLAEGILQPLPIATIIERQQAVQELHHEVEWRQHLQAIAMQIPVTEATERRAAGWAATPIQHFRQGWWKWFVIGYSVVSLGSAVAVTLGWIPLSMFSALYLLFIITSLVLSRNTIRPYIQLSGVVKEITVLYHLVAWMEGKPFVSPLLQRLQQDIKANGEAAAPQIKAIKTILDRFDLRISILGFLFLNPFLLWDVRQMIALNNWKKKNQEALGEWFAAVAQMEVLHTLATLSFNHPDWCVPSFSQQPFVLEGEDIGHPLIPAAARVNNDFSLQGKPKIGLVTGSNMAGKSTFLRSLGVNVVLAQMGAPVCAKQMTLSPMKLMSSMRIADNLSENTSTFYAELKKLKSIIEAVNQKEPLFILLDEILRGTNSMDRHKGSEALIHQLVRQQAVAIIATHDLELAKLEQLHSGILENYHFDVQVAGEELYFDYRLKHGICNSLNASILMKKIGIDL
jgi:hypothetical protein